MRIQRPFSSSQKMNVCNQLFVSVDFVFYLSWLEFIFDTMLEALSLDLHGGEDQAVTDEVRGIADTLARLETAKKRFQFDKTKTCTGRRESSWRNKSCLERLACFRNSLESGYRPVSAPWVSFTREFFTYQYRYGFSRSMFTELMGSSRNHVVKVNPFS